MNLQTIALSINLLIALIMGFVVLRNIKMSGAMSLSVLFFIISILSLCILLFNYLTLSIQDLFLIAGIYLCSTIAAIAQFIFVLSLTQRKHWLNRSVLISLATIPVLTQVLFWATPWRNALFGNPVDQTVSVIFLAGPWAKFNAFYIFILSTASVILLFDTYFRKQHSGLGSSEIILGFSVIPLLIEIFIFTGATIFSKLELLPFAFTLAALGFSDGQFNKKPEEGLADQFDRTAVVEGMDEGWMVLDLENTIVDINPAAERMTGLTRDKVINQPITSVLSDLPNLGQTLNGGQDAEVKRSIKSEEGWRYLNIRISTLADPDHKIFGRLVIWRDITDRRLADDARQRARDEMFVLINAISSAASNTLNLADFLLESIYHIIYPFRSQVVGIFQLDDRVKKGEDPKLFLASHFGFTPGAIEELASISTTSPMFDWEYKNRQPLLVEDAREDPRLPTALREMKLACLVIIPLITQAGEESKLIGFICMARKEKPVYSQDEIARLNTISDQIATLIDSDRRRKLAIALSERQR